MRYETKTSVAMARKVLSSPPSQETADHRERNDSEKRNMGTFPNSDRIRWPSRRSLLNRFSLSRSGKARGFGGYWPIGLTMFGVSEEAGDEDKSWLPHEILPRIDGPVEPARIESHWTSAPDDQRRQSRRWALPWASENDDGSFGIPSHSAEELVWYAFTATRASIGPAVRPEMNRSRTCLGELTHRLSPLVLLNFGRPPCEKQGQ